MQKFLALQSLLQWVIQNPHSDFYKNHLLTPPATFLLNEDLSLLKELTTRNLIDTPLNDRLYYKNNVGLVKIIQSHSKPFLIKRINDELKEEQYGKIYERPAALFNNSHEAIEKTLWCYEQGALPVIGEHINIPLSSFMIHRYKSDSFLGDFEMFKKVYDYNNPFSHTKIFNILGENFNLNELKKRISFSKLNLVLALPEIGAFASSCPYYLKKDKLIFHPDKNSILEVGERLLVTKLLFMPTPIIRYVTNIYPILENSICDCKKELSFSITHS